MSFFAPGHPAPDRPRPPRPVTPEWVGPPTDELCAVLPIDRFLHRSGSLVMALSSISVFSTGCIFAIAWTLRRSDESDAQWDEKQQLCMSSRHRGRPDKADALRFGVALPHGVRATTVDPPLWVGDPEQQPPGPVLDLRGGGGGGGPDEASGSTNLWLWPLPPAGDFRLVVGWAALGIPETSVTLDGTALQLAAGRVQPYWG